MREIVAELNNAMAKAAELQTSLYGIAVLAHCVKGEFVRLKLAQAEEARDVTHCIADNQAPDWTLFCKR